MRPPAPHIGRSLTLNFQGDWGRANLHRVLGVLCYELGKLSGPYTRIGIWNGRGGLDALRAVGRGQIDVAMTTPASFARLAHAGLGPSSGEAFHHLRAIGYVPQNDRMVVAVRSKFDIGSFAEFKSKRPALRITRGLTDGINFMGLAARELFAAHGLVEEEMIDWGCRFIEHEEPHLCVSDMAGGRADMIVMEAIMTPYWKDMADKIDLAFVPMEPAAEHLLVWLERRYLASGISARP